MTSSHSDEPMVEGASESAPEAVSPLLESIGALSRFTRIARVLTVTLPCYAALIAIPDKETLERIPIFNDAATLTLLISSVLLVLPWMLRAVFTVAFTDVSDERERPKEHFLHIALLLVAGFLCMATIQITATRLTDHYFYFFLGLLPLAAFAEKHRFHHSTLTFSFTTRFMTDAGTCLLLFLIWQPDAFTVAMLLSAAIACSTTTARTLIPELLKVERRQAAASASASEPFDPVAAAKAKRGRRKRSKTQEQINSNVVAATPQGTPRWQRRLVALLLVQAPLMVGGLTFISILPKIYYLCTLPLIMAGTRFIPSLELGERTPRVHGENLVREAYFCVGLLGCAMIVAQIVHRSW